MWPMPTLLPIRRNRAGSKCLILAPPSFEGGLFSDLLMTRPSSKLIPPYDGRLIDLHVQDEEREEMFEYASRLNSIQLSARAVCDLELLATGAFSPLDRFMGREDYASSVWCMRLSAGTIFPIPVTLPIPDGAKIELDSDIALHDLHNNILAVMTVEEIYEWNREEFSQHVLATQDLKHPLNAELARWGSLNISGRLQVLALPKHFDFQALRLTAHETRQRLETLGNENVVAFQTRNPPHRGHEEMCRRAVDSIGATLLFHPTVGLTKPGDVKAFTRMKAYKALIENYFNKQDTLLSLLPLAMRMAGPREAVWHMIIRRNYGANHFIVGRDHASPGRDSTGNNFYSSTAAQELALQFSDEIGVKPVIFDEIVYLPDEDHYQEKSTIGKDKRYFSMSGTQMRGNLRGGNRPPEWLCRPEIADIITATPHNNGFCVWLTGLSGAGKSTIAELLTAFLSENGRSVTLLDGDVVRTHLSKGLGFSREDRDTNIRRIGFVAAEIVRHGGVAICAAVSPYRSARDQVRATFDTGLFIEVFVDAPISVCEQRDVKGIYARARRGEIKNLTGIDDPYEPPEKAEVILDTENHSAEQNARRLFDHLADLGFVTTNSAW
jgi:sulfate adenylyltransferase